jgi:hypothetical protein
MNFSPGADFNISDIVYWAPSITADDALKRIVEQMSNYQAVFYAIHRTSVMRSVHTQLERVQSLLAHELLSSSLTLIAGGVYRLPHFYMARNTNLSISSEGWHPHHFLANKPDLLFREYAAYRAIVIEQLLADARCRATYRPDEMERILDLVHLKYLTPMISEQIIDYLLAESLHPRSEPRNIMMAIRDNLKSSSDKQRGIQRFLGNLRRTLCEPIHARNLVKHAIRLVLRKDFKISISLRLDKIYIDRIARDGRPRRYVLFRSFLNRRMPGGQRVTAADTSLILGQLDDYV